MTRDKNKAPPQPLDDFNVINCSNGDFEVKPIGRRVEQDAENSPKPENWLDRLEPKEGR